METIRPVVVDPTKDTKLVLQEVETTAPLPNEAVSQDLLARKYSGKAVLSVK